MRLKQTNFFSLSLAAVQDPGDEFRKKFKDFGKVFISKGYVYVSDSVVAVRRRVSGIFDCTKAELKQLEGKVIDGRSLHSAMDKLPDELFIADGMLQDDFADFCVKLEDPQGNYFTKLIALMEQVVEYPSKGVTRFKYSPWVMDACLDGLDIADGDGVQIIFKGRENPFIVCRFGDDEKIPDEVAIAAGLDVSAEKGE